MPVTLGIVAFLEAQPGKGDDLAHFLRSGREIAAAREEGTVTWYAFKVDDATYGIFDTFDSEAARQAHLDGEIPKALAQVGPGLLAGDPDIRTVEILAVK
jgi:quinol monooxygenase YgiN